MPGSRKTRRRGQRLLLRTVGGARWIKVEVVVFDGILWIPASPTHSKLSEINGNLQQASSRLEDSKSSQRFSRTLLLFLEDCHSRSAQA